jgi:FMN phosphatase YigB (HAD superfamily)
MNIIFDVGRVLCGVDLEIFTKKFEQIVSPKTNYTINGMDFLSSIQCMQDCGRTNMENSLMDLSRTFDSPLKFSEFNTLKTAWKDTIFPYEEMVELKDWLLKNNHKVAILSNMGHEHKSHMFSKFPKVFNGCFTCFSCDIGYRKPSKICFYLFLKQYPEFKNALYFDDLQENLDTGAGFGMITWKINLEKIYFDAPIFSKDIIAKEISSIKTYISQKT